MSVVGALCAAATYIERDLAMRGNPAEYGRNVLAQINDALFSNPERVMSNPANGEPSPKTSGSPIEALRAARTRLQEDRDNFAEFHRWGNGEYVSDSAAAKVAEYDAVLAQIDAALAEFDASLTDPADTRSDQTPQPVAYLCPGGCGCTWRDNHDGSMSLLGRNSRSCGVCEPLPLSKLIPLYDHPPSSYTPLSEEELFEIATMTIGDDDLSAAIEVGRAIERAVLERIGGEVKK